MMRQADAQTGRILTHHARRFVINRMLDNPDLPHGRRRAYEWTAAIGAVAQNLMYRWRCEDAADSEKHDAIEASPESQETEASGSSDGRLLRHIRFRTIWPLGQEFHPTWGSESEADHRDVSLPQS